MGGWVVGRWLGGRVVCWVGESTSGWVGEPAAYPYNHLPLPPPTYLKDALRYAMMESGLGDARERGIKDETEWKNLTTDLSLEVWGERYGGVRAWVG